MTTRHHHRTAPLPGLCLLAALLGTSPAFAAGPASAKAQLQRDRLACSRVHAEDAHQNCLSEASTAFASTQPTAADEDAASLARNALRRCARLPEPDRRDCQARMQGLGTTSGSVAEGGIYRELVTREVEAPSPAPDAAPAPVEVAK
jgi:hypothetical protein